MSCPCWFRPGGRGELGRHGPRPHDANEKTLAITEGPCRSSPRRAVKSVRFGLRLVWSDKRTCRPQSTAVSTDRQARVLVGDDDASVRRSLERGLRLSGFSVGLADGGRATLDALRNTPCDAVVLDILMPDMSGIAVCRALREDGNNVPVLMLSALDELGDRVAGLQAGGDDYLVKPFALQELELRLRALLRRRPPAATELIRAGGLEIDPRAYQARMDGVSLSLTGREFQLLEVLVRNAGLVLSREQLLSRVWGYDFEVRNDAVDTCVSYLRRKLEDGGRTRILHTVRGVGFVLRDDRP